MARTAQLRVASRRTCSASVSRPLTSENTARRSAAACVYIACVCTAQHLPSFVEGAPNLERGGGRTIFGEG
eukprot:6695660-Prymnesium_polylepis.1